jgi:hypothetical protein
MHDRLALGQVSAAGFYGEVIAIFVFGAATSTFLVNAG